MERYIKAQTMLDLFDRGLNPLPDAAQDEDVLVRCYQADRTRLEAYFTLYAIRVERHEQRLFADGPDHVYVLTWPGPLFKSHWEQRLSMKGARRKRAQ